MLLLGSGTSYRILEFLLMVECVGLWHAASRPVHRILPRKSAGEKQQNSSRGLRNEDGWRTSTGYYKEAPMLEESFILYGQ
jgi:hypothetical protein